MNKKVSIHEKYSIDYLDTAADNHILLTHLRTSQILSNKAKRGFWLLNKLW